MTERPLLWSAAITIAVAAFVGAALLSATSPAGAVAGLVAVIAWPIATVLLRLGRSRTGAAFAVVAVLSGSLAGGPSVGLSLVPAAVCTMLLIARLELPVWLGPVAAGVGVVLVCGGIALLSPQLGVSAMLTMSLGLSVGVLGGFLRRTTRLSAREAERAREERIVAREAEARIALARDLHDVLAHSLGGLTVQLDAIDALLEADRIDEARTRATEARRLAAQGLADARGAVAALREVPRLDDADVDPSEALDELIRAHRSLGATVSVTEGGEPRPVPHVVATALVRAVQESLSNARRHAPGAPVALGIDWRHDRVTLRVTSPLPAERQPRGGGYGLTGMRERFDALPSGGHARAEVREGEFVVVAEATLSPGIDEKGGR
ncbi:sensor histidine kinase [Microbacterium nymphoidis]|uniref:sensor histidine kinase n=1 Tax=Microbacterium nymphoidis TaxID=2898586 RepID=UPI001E2F06D0|nr:histidine kinase [Microbacterium nymphoidis]MCD2498288.1 histidine kinase [Microbacterium nymphoidis]